MATGTVLVVDDDPASVRFMALALADAGNTVLAAHDGGERALITRG